MYTTKKHGKADYSSYMQIPESVTSGVVEGPDETAYNEDTRYANLVYNVAPATLNLSGDIAIDSVGIDDTGLVKVSGDQLKVFDQELIDTVINQSDYIIQSLSATVISKNFSRVIQDRGDNVYFGHAKPGTNASDYKWRVYKLDIEGNKSWAGGGEFNQRVDIELSGLYYHY